MILNCFVGDITVDRYTGRPGDPGEVRVILCRDESRGVHILSRRRIPERQGLRLANSQEKRLSGFSIVRGKTLDLSVAFLPERNDRRRGLRFPLVRPHVKEEPNCAASDPAIAETFDHHDRKNHGPLFAAFHQRKI